MKKMKRNGGKCQRKREKGVGGKYWEKCHQES
jgi:hypothetical protein